jgi:isopentenyl-diphosphate delta-isomerase
MPTHTSTRKDDHIRISLEEDVTFNHTLTGLSHYRFVHQALPELNLRHVDTSTTFLGHTLTIPLLIASMTGGTAQAGHLNRTLAEVAQATSIGMGLGSTRAMIERPDTVWTFQVRQCAPDIPIFANLGAIQLNYGYGLDECQRIIDQTEADGLYLHLNPLQEALQPEGDTNFAGLITQIEKVCARLSVPVIVKEVGWGLSARVARMLIDAGVTALDVAGAGGTSWSQVEMYRGETPVQREVAASFRNWGIPTAQSITMVRSVDREIPLAASGGLQNGIDIAKCLALGADITTMAGALLRAAATSITTLHEQIEILTHQIRVAMFAAGAGTIEALKQTPLIKVETTT